MPVEPVVNIQEVACIWATAENRRLKKVIGAIRHADRRTPITPRANVRPHKIWANEKATQPSSAIARQSRDRTATPDVA